MCHHLFFAFMSPPLPADPDSLTVQQHGSDTCGTRTCDLSAKSETHHPNSEVTC